MLTRALTALGVLVSGAVHLWLWSDGMKDVDVVGPMFMLNAVAGLVIGLAVLFWRNWVPLFLAVGFGASTLLAFLISVTVGLFGVNEVFWGTWQAIAMLAELLAIVAGCAAIWQENRIFLASEWAKHRPARTPQQLP